MKENTNKAIAVNSLYLYIRLLIVSICDLLTTRFALQALGIYDFGLFSILGSIISFIAVFNTIMISTSNRFISVAIGRGDVSEINEQFNINLTIHFIIACVTLLLLVPMGDFYIHRYINYSGNIGTALNVFHITIIGSIVSFLGVPYNGLLIAKENFFLYSAAGIVSHAIKLVFAILLLYAFQNKLLTYAIVQGFVSVLPTIIYIVYSTYSYPEITKIKISKNKSKYLQVLGFSGWVSYGAFAMIGKNQGAAILVNMFFSTAMNTALGLANSVSSLLLNFSNSISQPFSPQITKSYIMGNFERTENLLVLNTKYTFFASLLISAPFLTNSSWIFKLWLGVVPDYVVEFTTLVLIENLITSLNSGISVLIFATGRIKLYQIVINTLRLLSILIAYFVLRNEYPATSLLLVYIAISIIIFFIGQYILNKVTGFANSTLLKKSYFPSILITILFIPTCFYHFVSIDVINIVITELYLVLLLFFVGCSSNEKKTVLNMLKKILLFKK